jgi:hypothetical protein
MNTTLTGSELMPSTLIGAIEQAATGRDLLLDQPRLDKLVALADYSGPNLEFESDGSFIDSKDGIRIEPSIGMLVDDEIGHEYHGSAELIYRPTIDGEVYDSAVDLEHVARITHNLISGLQNYVLLVEAGLIPEPTIIYADTNPKMAKVFERFGFKTETIIQSGQQESEDEIIAFGSVTFDDLQNRVFAADIIRLQTITGSRIARQLTGNAALSGAIESPFILPQQNAHRHALINV